MTEHKYVSFWAPVHMNKYLRHIVNENMPTSIHTNDNFFHFGNGGA